VRPPAVRQWLGRACVYLTFSRLKLRLSWSWSWSVHCQSLFTKDQRPGVAKGKGKARGPRPGKRQVAVSYGKGHAPAPAPAASACSMGPCEGGRGVWGPGVRGGGGGAGGGGGGGGAARAQQPQAGRAPPAPCWLLAVWPCPGGAPLARVSLGCRGLLGPPDGVWGRKTPLEITRA
jgi:hypothetical protein